MIQISKWPALRSITDRSKRPETMPTKWVVYRRKLNIVFFDIIEPARNTLGIHTLELRRIVHARHVPKRRWFKNHSASRSYIYDIQWCFIAKFSSLQLSCFFSKLSYVLSIQVGCGFRCWTFNWNKNPVYELPSLYTFRTSTGQTYGGNSASGSNVYTNTPYQDVTVSELCFTRKKHQRAQNSHDLLLSYCSKRN